MLLFPLQIVRLRPRKVVNLSDHAANVWQSWDWTQDPGLTDLVQLQWPLAQCVAKSEHMSFKHKEPGVPHFLDTVMT